MSITYELVKSWNETQGILHSLEEIKAWVEERKKNFHVNVEKVDFSYKGFWHYDERTGFIRNDNNSFFQLAGYQEIEDDIIIGEQPLIIQNEIGYLGFVCKMIKGVLHFLVQAKIEPGNINVIQLSPTIQATKSNFTRQHGGKTPKYLEYFINAKNHHIIVDQVQSEQSSRFYKKRNRNIVIMVDDKIDVNGSHMWMTLGQIKKCMRINNLVNMDTRTVLSCLPFSINDLDEGELGSVKKFFSDQALGESVFKSADSGKIHEIFNGINDRKMFRRDKSRLLPLRSLKGWEMTDKEIVCRTPYDFKVIYCRIEIEGREVSYWEQPLIEALGQSVFGIFTCVRGGVRYYLTRVREEMGCFDTAEVGPVVQMEPQSVKAMDEIEIFFMEKLKTGQGLLYDVVLSEEGGRFYHEQNRNVIIEIPEEELQSLPPDYFWVDYATLNHMVQFNNCINIQLRNLLSLLEV